MPDFAVSLFFCETDSAHENNESFLHSKAASFLISQNSLKLDPIVSFFSSLVFWASTKKRKTSAALMTNDYEAFILMSLNDLRKSFAMCYGKCCFLFVHVMNVRQNVWKVLSFRRDLIMSRRQITFIVFWDLKCNLMMEERNWRSSHLDSFLLLI